MVLGQSAGTLAVLAIERDCAVQDVPYETLAEWLRTDGQRVSRHEPERSLRRDRLAGTMAPKRGGP